MAGALVIIFESDVLWTAGPEFRETLALAAGPGVREAVAVGLVGPGARPDNEEVPRAPDAAPIPERPPVTSVETTPAPPRPRGAVKPELLAPAGDRTCLVAAVENGADAVYYGGKRGHS